MKGILLYFILSLSFLLSFEIYFAPGFHMNNFATNTSLLTESWESDHPDNQSDKYSNISTSGFSVPTVDFGLMNQGELYFNKNLDFVIGIDLTFQPFNIEKVEWFSNLDIYS